MAAQFDSAPAETYVPANQVLMYTIKSSVTLTASDRFIVQVYKNLSEVAKLYLTPNPSGRAFFDLSTIVKEMVEVDVLVSSGSGTVFESTNKVNVSTSATDKFQVKIGSFNGTSETTAEATKLIYLVQGTEQISDGLHPSFANYYPTSYAVAPTRGYLTEMWGFSNDRIKWNFATEDEGSIAWIHDDLIISGVDTHITYQLYNSSGALGSAETVAISTSGGNALSSTAWSEKVHYTGLAPASLSWTTLPSANPDWTGYNIWLNNNSTLRGGKYIYVERDYGICKNNRVQIAFANRVGGWDYLNFDGRPSKNETTEKKPYLTAIGDFNGSTYSFDPTARTSKPYHVTAKTNYKLNSINWDKQTYQLLEGLLRSSNIMMRIQDSSSEASYLPDRNKWLPVLLNTKSLSIKDFDSSEVVNVSIDVELAQDIRC